MILILGNSEWDRRFEIWGFLRYLFVIIYGLVVFIIKVNEVDFIGIYIKKFICNYFRVLGYISVCILLKIF